VDTFEGSLDKMKATNFEANQEAMEAIVEQQELRKRLAVRHHRWAKKWTRPCWFPAEVICRLEITDMLRCPCTAKGKCL
jgi:hypothetical protein